MNNKDLERFAKQGLDAAFAGMTNKPTVLKLAGNGLSQEGKGIVLVQGHFKRNGREYVASGEATYPLPPTIDKLQTAAVEAGRLLGQAARKLKVKSL